ncbi:MAG TPA: indolepyruvate ferredoxin oxidoreductase family protein [Rhizomicrobium sp.]|nr:indolepyruvate ferredoxin oxidoreductase family protein [Rhizomicrobium sp.]
MTKTAVQLDDKFTQDDGRVYITSMQALVRLPMVQRRRDLAAGLNTAGYISGYRGSPLGTYDAALWAAGKLLKEHHIVFVPGVNEELAAASIRGAQEMEWFEGPKYDGVFSIWYGKGLGVDRAIEALKMANFEGASKHGGVLVVCGDDHGGKSSATAHQSEQALISAMIPILYPANTQEILDYGIYGWALSRYSGTWVGLKATNDTLEVTASVYADPHRVTIITPTDFELPPGGLNLRRNDFPLPQEDRLVNRRLPAVQAFVRANGIDRVVIDGARRELGIVTAGKVYLDVCQALRDLALDEVRAAALGIRLYKIGLTWPIEPQGLTAFARGHREILVVEEKREVMEEQIARILYPLDTNERPAIVGKRDESGRVLLPANGDLNAALVREAIAARLHALGLADAALDERMARIKAGYEKGISAATGTNVIRTAYFCSGCPHNTSTRVPEGSLAFQGVGCHALAAYFMPDRPHAWTVQMGGEGAIWLGLAPFTSVNHTFQNLGDGTYFHSGILAVRASVAAKRNITYKLLYNDAIAMTGGQPLEGEMSVLMLAQQLYWEGVKPIVVVTDEPDKYPADTLWPAGTTIRHRDELDAVQKELREIKGVSALIYDQTCAAEKRRRRKRGKFPDPNKRVFINQDVCEGCGDCSVQSNCVSVQPLDTEFGRKRVIDQSSCNKDYSCLKGFCPSFITVEGGALRKADKPQGGDALAQALAKLPAAQAFVLQGEYDVLVTGIGGTGVTTVGAILGMAAHIEEKGCTIMDMTGMAQKGGAVLSHLRIADRPENIFSPRLGPGMADLIIGCDLVVTTSKDAMQTVHTGVTRAAVNSHLVPTAQFQANSKIDFGTEKIRKTIVDVVGADRTAFVDATTLSTRLLGDSIATNLFMVGFAAQLGWLPLSTDTIEQAIRLNGVSIEQNLRTFRWGRVAAHDPSAAEAAATSAAGLDLEPEHFSRTLDELIARRAKLLTNYQSTAYGKRYTDFVAEVRRREAEISPETALTEAVARNLAKLMAYKDEYEVARLHTDAAELTRLKAQFDGNYKIKLHLAPPLLARRDKNTGHPKKMEFGPWIFPMLGLLKRFKGLRGTPFDVFGYSRERRIERQLVADYKNVIRHLLRGLTVGNLPQAVEIANVPDDIRGYGHIKEANLKSAKAKEAKLLEAFNRRDAMRLAAE